MPPTRLLPQLMPPTPSKALPVPHQNIGRVVYYESPEKFYFLRHSNKVADDHIEAYLRNHHFEIADGPTVTELKLGNMYLTTSPLNEAYCRVTALKFYPSDGTFGHCTLCRFLDLGLVDWVTTKRLRAVPDELTDFQPLAEECLVGDICPAGGAWTEEAHKGFLSLVEDTDCFLCVNDMAGAVMVVDLMAYTQMGRTTSMREYLVWTHHAKYLPRPRKNLNGSILSTSGSSHRPPTKKKKSWLGAEHDERNIAELSRLLTASFVGTVRLTDVYNPYDLHVTPVCVDGRDIEKKMRQLAAKMEEFYCVQEPYGTIYEGTAVAFRDPGTETWCRASVDRLLSVNSVEVTLLDVGAARVVPTRDLRLLERKFFRPDATAANVGFDNVLPMDKANWDRPKIQKFLKKFMGESLILVCLPKAGEKPEDDKLNDPNSVRPCRLFRLGDEGELECLVDRLVDAGLARIHPQWAADTPAGRLRRRYCEVMAKGHLDANFKGNEVPL